MDEPLHMELCHRLRRMRDRSIRQPGYRQVYAHALMVAHMSGRMVAVDDPALQRIRAAIDAARRGDTGALDRIDRDLSQLGA